MKYLLFFGFLCSNLLAQENIPLTTSKEKKNEIKYVLVLNAGGFSNALQYERNFNTKFSAGIFLKNNFSSININDTHAIENIGIGINSHLYLNKYRTPTFLEYYNINSVFVRYFIETGIEYIGIEWYESQRNLKSDAYVISREIEKINTTNLHFGIGNKYLFNNSYLLQTSLGINRYLTKIDYLKYGAYINISFGYLF